MKRRIMPETKFGKWSVGLHAFFLIAVVISLFLVFGIHVLSFEEGHWWDVMVSIIFPASLMASITGISAFFRYKDRSLLVILSLILGICVILFLLLHSLFISD